MLFRIEDEFDENNLREYSKVLDDSILFHMTEADTYIAREIKREVNCSTKRSLLSYSKSLIMSLVKYNEYVDNPLHISFADETNGINWLRGIDTNGYEFCIHYDIRNGFVHNNSFIPDRFIIKNFVIDISDNELLDRYIYSRTGKHKKVYASPQKDCEVVVYQSPHDIILAPDVYIEAVYLMLALEIRCGFLNADDVYCNLYQEIQTLDEFRFANNPQDRDTLLMLIKYLHLNGKFERIQSGFFKNIHHLSYCYDGISQLLDIIFGKENFEDYWGYSLFDTVVSDIIWRNCGEYLEEYPLAWKKIN